MHAARSTVQAVASGATAPPVPPVVVLLPATAPSLALDADVAMALHVPCIGGDSGCESLPLPV